MKKIRFPQRGKKIKERLQHLTAGLKSIGDGLIVTDAARHIVFINQAALQITGWQLSESMGQSVDKIFRLINLKTNQPVPSPFEKVLKEVSSTGLAKDSAIVTKIGAKLYVSANISPILVEGRLVGTTAVFRDIARLRLAEEELVAAKEAAEIANKAKGQFLANMSHEIRTPLNGMLGMIDLTMNTALTAEQKENLVIAKSCAQTLLNVINDILDFSKMEAGKMVISSLPFAMKEVVAKMVSMHGIKAQEKGLALTSNIPDDLPVVVKGDAMRLQQVLHNLLGNAIKFTDQGFVELTVYCDLLQEDWYEFAFAVSDSGIGLSEADKECLFKSFSQVDGSLTRKYGGTGLGLAISKQLVELMGGRIWVDSQKGQGSTFYFTVKCQAGGLLLENPASFPETKRIGQSISILLVEDEKINQKVMEKMLKEKGYLLQIANNGLEALEMLAKQSFDLILMDIQMPEMDGVEATRRIRQKEANDKKRIPIIAVTAYALAGDRERFLLAGMDGYIAKPVEMLQLFSLIEKLVAKSRTDEILRNLAGGKKIEVREEALITENIRLNFYKLQEAYEKEDYALIEKIAHTIKEAGADLREDGVKSLGFRIELAARKENLEEIAELVSVLSTTISSLTGGDYHENFDC